MWSGILRQTMLFKAFHIPYSSRFVIIFFDLLQNKHPALAENGEILVSAQPRISAHSQGPKI